MRSGFGIAAASWAIGIDEVFEAMIVSPSTSSATSVSTIVFIWTSSGTASITSSAPPRHRARS